MTVSKPAEPYSAFPEKRGLGEGDLSVDALTKARLTPLDSTEGYYAELYSQPVRAGAGAAEQRDKSVATLILSSGLIRLSSTLTHAHLYRLRPDCPPPDVGGRTRWVCDEVLSHLVLLLRMREAAKARLIPDYKARYIASPHLFTLICGADATGSDDVKGPLQKGDDDCFFVMAKGTCYSLDNLPLTFTQADMTFFRRRLIADLLCGSRYGDKEGTDIFKHYIVHVDLRMDKFLGARAVGDFDDTNESRAQGFFDLSEDTDEE